MKRTGPLSRRTALKRTRLRKVNRERRARMYERNFGEKAEWLRTLPCPVTGARGRALEIAHVGHRRGMGGCGPDGNTRILQLHWRVHRDEEANLPDGEMRARWGVTRADLTALAADLDRQWREMSGSGGV